MFKKSKINFEIKILSSHRDIKNLISQLAPIRLKKNHIGVILAIAHSVTNLPAIIAGYLKDSPIHIIGVGLTKTDADSIESLLSVISIPKGVPLLNSGIGGVGLCNVAFAV